MKKPDDVARDPWMSAKWDELAPVAKGDAEALAALVRLHAIARRCSEDIAAMGGQVAYQDASGNLREVPQVATLCRASAEVRAIMKRLDAVKAAPADKGEGSKILDLARARRRKAAG